MQLLWSKQTRVLILFGGAVICATATFAAESPIMGSVAKDYHLARDLVIRSAEEMPPESYQFRPTPEVRTFGQILGHVADDQYNLCAPVKGDTRKRAYTQIEETVSGKQALVSNLREAFLYCDAAYDAVTDKTANDMVSFLRSERSKFAMLNWNNWHTWEHYGNLVVYLRMKGLEPPSSQKTR